MRSNIRRKAITELKKEIQETNKYPIEKQQLKMFKAISEYDYAKSFTMLYRIDKKEMKLKIKNVDCFKYYKKAIFAFMVLTEKQNAEFEKVFGKSDIKPENIEEITYGRNTVFKKNI